MNKTLTIILTLFAFSLTACAPTFKDPMLQKTYEACTASKISVADMKLKLKSAMGSNINFESLSNDKKAFCKSAVELIEKDMNKEQISKEQKDKALNLFIKYFKTGKIPK